MRNLTIIFLFPVLLNAQGGTVWENQEINPCGEGNLILNKPAVPQAFNREADMMWNKRVWREIDLREKLNQTLYYPVDYQACRISLFQIVTKHILRGEIIPFEDEEFYKPMRLSEIRKKLVQEMEVDEIIYTPNGDELIQKVKSYDSSSIFTNVIKVRMVEDWYFNSGRSDMEVRITGMAFYEYVEEKEAYKELFWVYFPAVKPFLAKYRSFNPRNTFDNSSFDDLFARRQFGSYVVKESNVYDRYVFDYAKGVDALLESDRIKNDVFKYEHDLWHY